MAEDCQVSDLPRLEYLDFRHDGDIDLPALDEYIKLMRRRKIKKVSLPFQRAAVLQKFPANALPIWPSSSTSEYTLYNLKAIEAWIASNLGPWLSRHKNSPLTCGLLASLIQKYHGLASPLYAGNPEATSIMLLTILELWIACDCSATGHSGLLREYDPGVPRQFLESLVLPLKSQMERLLRADQYLISRKNSAAKYPSPHIFQSFGEVDSFSVRYFDQSVEHQKLLKDIENQATVARKRKCAEFAQKKGEYMNFMQLHDNAECEYEEVVTDRINDFRDRQHKTECKKCHYKEQAAGLGIKIYEWPLPSDIQEARSTVFELKVPAFFGHWRDTTIFFILDVLKNDYQPKYSSRVKYHPKKFWGLSSFCSSFSPMQRIGLLSPSKPHCVTHPREKAVSTADESDVCLDNGLDYRYYDNICECFVTGINIKDTIASACMYKLPDRSSSLQPFLFRAANIKGPSPNTVIAHQAKCPSHISLDEFKALGTIPLGYRLQWQNILLQLSVPTVDFKIAETSLVILQSICQAGPPSNDGFLRAGHDIVDDENFAHSLLGAPQDALSRVKENWEYSQALSTFIALASRLLSLTSSQQIARKALAYLADVRCVAVSWVNLLKDKIQRALNDAQRMDLSSKVVEIALIGVDSFNLDDRYLVVILSDPKVASIFLQCSIVIQEGELSISRTSNAMIPLLHHRWKGNSYRCYPILARGILEDAGNSLDEAIKQSWSSYEAGYGWQAVSAQNDHWLVGQTMPPGDGEGDPLSVHFNLLTSELLVNGVPLTRLPSQYECHPTYRTLLGNSHLEVMPSTIKGMQYSGKKDHAGFTLHFGMPNSTSDSTKNDLLVQAVKGGQHYELIPSRLFREHFPAAFAEGYVHWYDIKNHSVEFRPIKDPWTSSSHHWKLTLLRSASKWQLKKDGNSLIGVRTETAKVVSGILSPLEVPERIQIIFHPSSSSVDIELPRLHLGFSLKSCTTLINSRQFPGMSLDSDQSLGTLVGFRNKLILKHKTDGHRLILLPEGNVSYCRDCDHVHVGIDNESTTRAHAYQVDNRLGRLVDNGSFQSKLFLAYVHALTSFCLPDPLLHRTGTEQALSILRSAAVRSFDRLAHENIELLGCIARLTPGRIYYPENERVMQTVDWSPKLGFLAQHGEFYKCVKSIFDQATVAKVFYPDTVLPQLDHVELELLERDSIRSSTFRVSGFGAEVHTIDEDTEYSARDRNQSSAQGLNSFVISSFVYQKRSSLPFPISADLGNHLWRYLEHSTQILGLHHPLPSTDLRYDAGLLASSSDFICRYWLNLHQTLSEGLSIDRFSLMIWLSTLAFAPNVDLQMLQTLALFFALPAMGHISLPTPNSFRLQRGLKADRSELQSIAQSEFRPLAGLSLPEAMLTAEPKESQFDFKKRQQRVFQKGRKDALNRLVSAFEAQWPCESPTTPIDSHCLSFDEYIDVEKVVQDVKPSFKAWSDNNRFLKYLGQVEETLARQAVSRIEMLSPAMTTPQWSPREKHGFISIDEIFACSASLVLAATKLSMPDLMSPVPDADSTKPRLPALIERLERSSSSQYATDYAKDLRESDISRKRRTKVYCLKSKGADVREALADYSRRCKEEIHTIYKCIVSALNGSEKTAAVSAIAIDVKQWPRLCPILLLQQLNRGRWAKLTNVWKHNIIAYGLALSSLQQAERLLALCSNPVELTKELQNLGHTNWDPFDFPESLLLEIESGITICEVQEQIARQMRDPPSGKNAVMQLNMGEGKSSVLVPIVAAALADGLRLIRVIVAKPQSKQMLEMLASKLGGLLDRRIYHMPFSRALKLGESEANDIGSLYRECRALGGILLVQPEHILSFKLMGLECLISDKEAVGRSLLRTQHFFEASSRDIVDESD